MYWRWIAIILAVVIVFQTRRYLISEDTEARLVRSSISPGPLSAKHASIENKCENCHSPIKGVEAVNCIQCHANDTSLLKRQPTAFHASIKECAGCHVEHSGASVRPVTMDHEYLSRMGLKQLDAESGSSLVSFLHSIDSHSDKTPEKLLNCATCHSNDDKHFKLFGNECSDCHLTRTWKIASFRHPSPQSTDCSQCHQAPPSHYMMHFHMISEKVAHVEHANVNQCFLCHQTTSWNDIKGVGWYKHH